MGVPKFFRWMSERYPAISQLIAENRIPEFDALYLDMNGIIHNCTHKDSDSPTYRMSEEKMFIAIFNYIEHLFGKIKPQKLFFLAIDGVAPRAKMNQQRARRFRTALDADKARQKAIKEGLEMPAEEPFDSNCITPGTGFMANLTKQLKYFIHKKVSEDVDWQGVDIILSGHEVPGEGEHKIMEYIRLAKAQPDYDPNVRHCLYGLDADLIMLGLLSHDPHFCLLREEVTFGRQSQKKSKELEHQNFYLMHLSIVREYLELEFQELQQPGVLNFRYDFERVLDDFILLAFFVGNDFLPNLPGLHINEGALSLMFKIYKTILPKANGYINERGTVNLERLALVLTEMEAHEFRVFESEHSDASWFKGKQKKEIEALKKSQSQGKLVITSGQKAIYTQIKAFVQKRGPQATKTYDLPTTLAAGDRKFVEDLANMLRLQCATVENDDGERHLRLSFFPSDDDSDEEEDEEAHLALLRVFKAIEKAPVVDISADEAKAELERIYQEKFQSWRDDYYKEKFEFGLKDEEDIRKLAENYIEGLQWVLNYYYKGVASWGWFYAYHYSPKITDIKQGLNAKLTFDLGVPFRPFEQLMGVLPDRSKSIVPEVYHSLMTSPDSPIIDFYPRDFELDMNGKKMEWEAVVKIPFIDEKRLLTAMKPRNALLSEDEKIRNEFGVTLKFTHAPGVEYVYPTSMANVFPDIVHCQCVMNTFELPTLEGGLNLITGLCEGVRLGADALAGFPSLKTLNHTAQLGFHGVNVFQQDSKNESMVVTLASFENESLTQIATKKLNTKVHIGYPFLQEALVTAVTDEMFDYVLGDNDQVLPVPHSQNEIDAWRKKAERIENHYSKRMGMIIGPVEVIAQVALLSGLRRTDEGAMVKEFSKVPGMETEFSLQTLVEHHVVSEDQRFIEKEAVPIGEEFPEGTRAFFLGDFNYGRPLEVIGCRDGNKADIWVATMKGKEPDFGHKLARAAESITKYMPSFAVAKMLGLNGLTLSKITSSFSVLVDDTRVNLGLNLKFEAKKLKVLGYSRKGETGWEFSQKAISLIMEYVQKFPEFFRGIQQTPTADMIEATDIFPEKVAKEKIKDIRNWLKEIEAKSFEKVPLESEQLDADVVKMIETEADRYVVANPSGEATRIKGVPRKALLKPSDAEHRLQNQKFALGDRIVYVQDSGKVPIATKGTVIGITKTPRLLLLDVVFDVSFMSGSTLGDRCSPFRGMTIPFSSALNLSMRQLVAQTKASSNAKTEVAQIHGNGLRAAPAPPPIHGSYSNAVRGAHGPSRSINGRGNGPVRGRGRGGSTQSSQPLTHINGQNGNRVHENNDTTTTAHHPRILQRGQVGRGGPPQNAGRGGRGNQTTSQSQPQPTSFASVPPPAVLNAPSRGNARGRVGRTRGRGRGNATQTAAS